MNVILSTRNPSKAEQIRALFAGSCLRVFSLDEAHISGEAVEDGTTLEENAFKKAWFAHTHARKNVWAMADDTGLYIHALNGEPGVYAARWAGENKTTDEITQYCLKRMENVENRSATFRTAVAVIGPDGTRYSFTGEVEGRLRQAPRVQPQPKMPYSALFVPAGHDLSWAEMSVEEENAISHRGIAFRSARAFLERLFTEERV